MCACVTSLSEEEKLLPLGRTAVDDALFCGGSLGKVTQSLTKANMTAYKACVSEKELPNQISAPFVSFLFLSPDASQSNV